MSAPAAIPDPALCRLREIGRRHALEPDAVDVLARLVQAIADDPHAPTTVRDPMAVTDVHVADALSALELDIVRAAGRAADLGSGAGIPGLALAVALPASSWTLVESVARKGRFIAELAGVLGLGNVEVAPVRAEEWHAGIDTCDLVTARALAPLAVIQEYAAPLLVVGGALVAWKGRREPDEERDSAAAAAELGLELAEVRRVQPYPSSEHCHLHVYLKVRGTPARFPRRPGMARKRPLRATGA